MDDRSDEQTSKAFRPVSFRRTPARLAVAFFMAGFVFIALVVILGGGRWSPEYRFGAYVPMAVISSFIVVRQLRSGLFLDARGVKVRNLLRTYEIPWNSVAGFERPAPYGTLRKAGLKIRRRDGSYVTSSLYAAGPLNSWTFADKTLTDLNDLLEVYSAGSS